MTFEHKRNETQKKWNKYSFLHDEMETECGHWSLAFSSAYKRLFRAIPLFANEKKGVELLDYLGVFDPNGKNLDSRLRLFLGCIISSCQVNAHKNLQIQVTKNISG